MVDDKEYKERQKVLKKREELVKKVCDKLGINKEELKELIRSLQLH